MTGSTGPHSPRLTGFCQLLAHLFAGTRRLQHSQLASASIRYQTRIQIQTDTGLLCANNLPSILTNETTNQGRAGMAWHGTAWYLRGPHIRGALAMYPFSTPRLRATALSAWYRFHSYHLNRIEYYRRAMLNSMAKKRSKPKGTKTTSAHRAVSLTLFRSYGCWNGITAPCTSTHVPVLLMPVPTDDPGGDGDWSTESKSAMQEQEQPRKAKGLRTLCKTEVRVG